MQKLDNGANGEKLRYQRLNDAQSQRSMGLRYPHRPPQVPPKVNKRGPCVASAEKGDPCGIPSSHSFRGDYADCIVDIADVDRYVRMSGPDAVTRARGQRELPMVPPTPPFAPTCFDVDSLNHAKYNQDMGREKKSCVDQSKTSYIPYRYQYFDHLGYNPQNVTYIDEVENFRKIDPNYASRAGIDTRHSHQIRQRNCGGGPNLSTYKLPKLAKSDSAAIL